MSVAHQYQERRRTPRVALEGIHEFRLARRVRVRIVDISAGGVLLAADERVPVGSVGRLQVSLGGNQFEGQVQIKREQPVLSGQGHLLGGVVTPSQPRHQEALDQFLRRAGN
jgi:hypothetical protein